MELAPRRRARLEALVLGLVPAVAALLGVALVVRDVLLLVLMGLLLTVPEVLRSRRWSLLTGPVGLTSHRPGARGVVTTYAAWEHLVGVGRLRGIVGSTTCLVYDRPQPQRGPRSVVAAEARVGLDRVVPTGAFDPVQVAAEVARVRPDVDLGGQVPLPAELAAAERRAVGRWLLLLAVHAVTGLLVGLLLRALGLF